VYEITSEGRSLRLAGDSLRARYREGLREAKLIRTRDPLLYAFERFPFVARVVRKGSRLRLVVGAIDSIYSQKNFNGGGCVSAESMETARVVRVQLFHDAEHPSVLHVPLAAPS
jgi:hypothetical protein